MAADRKILLRAFIRAAKIYGDRVSKTPQEVLEDVIVGRFSVEATIGKTVISTNENGGGVVFQLPPDFGPREVLGLAEEAIEMLLQMPDPENPNLSPRRITRLAVNFLRSQP